MFGLNIGKAIFLSLVGALVAASVTFWMIGRRLSAEPISNFRDVKPEDGDRPNLMAITNVRGGHAVQSMIGIPMLLIRAHAKTGQKRDAEKFATSVEGARPAMRSATMRPLTGPVAKPMWP